MRRSTTMTAWAIVLAALLLGQHHSSIGVNALAIRYNEAADLQRAAAASQSNIALEEHNTSSASYKRKRQMATRILGMVDGIAAVQNLPSASSSSTTSLPWCSDMESISSAITSSSISSATSSTTSSSSIPSSIISTSSSAGEAICIAIPTSSTYSSPSTSTIPSSNAVHTIIVAPSRASQVSGRPRSTRTVTAIQTLQRQVEPAPSTTVVQVTSTVVVLSTTTYLNTVYTTITPRPTAAWVTS